jgi:hypothetical protein
MVIFRSSRAGKRSGLDDTGFPRSRLIIFNLFEKKGLDTGDPDLNPSIYGHYFSCDIHPKKPLTYVRGSHLRQHATNYYLSAFVQ